MFVLRWLGRGVQGLLRASAGAVGGPDPRRLRRRMRPVEDWADTVDGRARRLGPRETIRVTRTGSFADVDPLRPAEGWRDGWRAAVVGSWLVVVGVAAARGRWRGSGSLAALRDLGAGDGEGGGR